MLTLASHQQHPGHAQNFEVVRDRRLRDVEPLRHLASAELATRGDLLNHAEPRRIAQRPERPHERPIVQLTDVFQDHDPLIWGRRQAPPN